MSPRHDDVVIVRYPSMIGHQAGIDYRHQIAS